MFVCMFRAKKYLLFLCIVIISLLKVKAQSSSSGEVLTIESIVNQILGINNQIEGIKKRLQENEKKVGIIKKSIANIPLEIADIEAEKQKMIAECRNGYYCDQCNNSKSEIESKGTETFSQHLKRVSGRAVAMPEDKIKQKEKAFDDRIAAVKARLPQLQASKMEEEDKWVFIKQEQLDLEEKIGPLKQKIYEHCRLWKVAREKEHDDSYAKWVRMVLPPITESVVNQCQTKKLQKKHSDFLSNADQMIWNLGIEFERSIDNKISRTGISLNEQIAETWRLKKQKEDALQQILQLIEQRKKDSINYVNDFNKTPLKKAVDSFNFRTKITDIAYEIKSKRVEYKRIEAEWNNGKIKESLHKEQYLTDSINLIRKEKFSRVLSFKDQLKLKKSKGDSLFIKAISAMKKQVERIDREIEQSKKSLINDVASFNQTTFMQQEKISSLLGKIGMYSNYGVVKYQEWSVFENIKTSLIDAANSAIGSGRMFEPILTNNVDKGFDRGAWSMNVLNACNEDKSSGFNTMKNAAVTSRMKALEDRFK